MSIRTKQCYFCTNNVRRIDYKDAETLKKFTDSMAKIISAKESKNCAKHQRKLTEAIKRARFLALLPYVGE